MMAEEKGIQPTDNKSDEDKYSISANVESADDRVQVLNNCDTFGVFDRWGDILSGGKGIHGLYFKDTRYISNLELRINGYRPILLSSDIEEENEILSVDLTNPEILLPDKEILRYGTIHIKRSQNIRNYFFREKIELENFGHFTHTFKLSFKFNSDFRDIFEVRGAKRAARGTFLGCDFSGNNKIVMRYKGRDNVIRSTQIVFSLPYHNSYPDKRMIVYSFELPPKKILEIQYVISFFIHENESTNDLAREIEEQKSSAAKIPFPEIETSNEQFTHWINRSKTDLFSLLADTPYGKYPYAGVPWYNTAFGRDGIITALETLWIFPELSRSVLLFLAAHQATTVIESQDAEPGKILHETRGGEMVNLNEVPFKKYYGSIDSTPLFVLLAGNYYERTGDLHTIKKIWKEIQLAVQWIDRYGDVDGDGFVEYKHKASNGLTNQGWKDSHDSVFYEDGTLAEPPIALCEVQGYVYAAKMKASKLAYHLGEKQLSVRWKEEAKRLKEKFNEAFWDDRMNCYVIALDGNKKPCRVKTSNAAHLLFTGIATKLKAKKIASAFMRSDMFNGWGIRTVSYNEKNYNPMSYHNGSVWPHDVALIAAGFAHYELSHETLKLLTGLFDASLFINLQRLPELFCGFDRRKGEGPTAYPVACSPQAWSVAAVFSLLQSVLRIEVSPLQKKIIFEKPFLPPYLNSIRILRLPLCNDNTQLIDLEITRYESNTMIGVNSRNLPKDWKLVIIK